MSTIGSSRIKEVAVDLDGSRHKVKQIWVGSNLVYSAGSTVTYYVDTSTVYTEEVDSGASCLSPTTFTPTKSGYTFVGWRTDTVASSSVLSSLTMEYEPITLYAVFAKTITLTYYATSSAASTTTGTQYYNNGNISNPSFTISDPSLSGWTFLGWIAGSTSATGTVTYSSISSKTFSASATLYAKFSQTITITYYSTSSTAATTSGTRYFNAAGNYSNPTFTISSPSLSGWTFLGWTTSTSATGTVSYDSISATAFSSSITLYGKFSQTITLSYNGNGSTSGSVSSQTGTRYFNAAGYYNNPTFTLASNGYTKTNYVFLKWASGSTSGTQYSAGASVTLSASTTFYAIWTIVTYTARLEAYVYFSTSANATQIRLRLYNNSTGTLIATQYHTSSSGTYWYSPVSYFGLVQCTLFETSARPLAAGPAYARLTALTTLYSNSGLSSVYLSSGGYINYDVGSDGSSSTTYTFYAKCSYYAD